jgi:alpha-1,6-mannosyltransferase
MKICDATQFYSEVGGGVGRYLNEKRAYVRRRGEDSHLLLVPGSETRKIRDEAGSIIEIGSPLINRTSRYRVMLNLARAEEMLSQEQPDVIESGDPYHLGWRMVALGRTLNIPVVGFYHSHFPEAYLRTALKYGGRLARDGILDLARRYIVRLYNRFDATVVPSNELRELLEEWGVQNTHFLHLGVDSQVFSPEPDPGLDTSDLPELDPGRFWLLYVGRLAGEKNTRVLLRAFELLEKRHPGEFGFVVIGDGALRPLMEGAGSQLEAFHWCSYCSDSRMLAEWYRRVDLFVHPGIYETFGLVALESQSCGCPVVGIRGSKMDANIVEGLDQWADENSPEALAAAMLRMRGLDLKAMAPRLSQSVRERYSWDVVFGQLWDLYGELQKMKKSGHQP